jgi:hypothetical protein
VTSAKFTRRPGVLAVFLLLPVGCAAKGSSTPPGDEPEDGSPPASDGAAGPMGSSVVPEADTNADAASPPPAEGGTAPDGASSSTCSSLPLCDGFESDTPGMPPDTSLWTVLMGCNPNSTNAPVDGGLTVGIDGTVAHTGKNSLRVVGGDSCGYYAINTSAFAKLTGQVYARFYAQFSGAPTSNHNGFMSMYSGTATNFLSMYSNSEQLRLGFQGNVVVWNYLSSDATLPDIDSMGESQSMMTHPNAWDCIEFHLDPTDGYIEFWLNGTSVSGLSYDGTSTQGVSDNWHTGGPTSLALKSFGLGWLGLNNQYTAWFDDVALSSARINCE